MWSVTWETINGMMLGIEFPTWVPLKENTIDEDTPNPFVIQLDLLIIRIHFIRI